MNNSLQTNPDTSSPATAEKPIPVWLSTFLAEFQKETDRASVILTAAMLDDVLSELLKARLVPCPGSADALFDDANAPLANFSSRIEMSFRLGLISHRFARDMHLVRKIRNSFAHNISGCHFKDMSVLNRIKALEQSMGVNAAKDIPAHLNKDDPKEMFCYMCGYMLWILHSAKNSVPCLRIDDALDDTL